MDVGLVEQGRLDAKVRRARFDVRAGGRDGFLHYVAQIARNGHTTLAEHLHRFDGQRIATHFSPSKASNGPHLILGFCLAKANLAHTQIVFDVFRRDRDGFFLLLADFAHGFTGQIGDFPLKATDTGFPRVIADHFAQAVIRQREFTSAQTIGVDLLLQKVTLSDFNLFIFSIARDTDDLHAVQQGLGHVERVGCGHEHHV